MQIQTSLSAYLEQGRQALAKGQGREAAMAYAHAAQLEPDNPAVHLGLAEANLALGDLENVENACSKVFTLKSEEIEAKTAQVLLDLLDQRYEQALRNVEAVISEDPSDPYIHALRSYLLRANGQDYDASLARARARRLSFGGNFDNCFPSLEASSDLNGDKLVEGKSPDRPRFTAWDRRMTRAHFFINQHVGFLTNVIILINTLVYLLGLNTNTWLFFSYLPQYNPLVQAGQYWRLFTDIFYFPPGDFSSSILPFIISMLSLFFIGRGVEIFYGYGRFVILYFLTGFSGSLVCYLLYSTGILPHLTTGLGPASAILGIFSAFGMFFIVNRRWLGPTATNGIMNWGFWLLLNLAFARSSEIMIAELISLGVSLFIAFLLTPRLNGHARVR